MILSSGTDPTTIHVLVINEKNHLKVQRVTAYTNNNFMPRRFWEIGSFINVQRVTHKNSMFSVFYLNNQFINKFGNCCVEKKIRFGLKFK